MRINGGLDREQVALDYRAVRKQSPRSVGRGDESKPNQESNGGRKATTDQNKSKKTKQLIREKDRSPVWEMNATTLLLKGIWSEVVVPLLHGFIS